MDVWKTITRVIWLQVLVSIWRPPIEWFPRVYRVTSRSGAIKAGLRKIHVHLTWLNKTSNADRTCHFHSLWYTVMQVCRRITLYQSATQWSPQSHKFPVKGSNVAWSLAWYITSFCLHVRRRCCHGHGTRIPPLAAYINECRIQRCYSGQGWT